MPGISAEKEEKFLSFSLYLILQAWLILSIGHAYQKLADTAMWEMTLAGIVCPVKQRRVNEIDLRAGKPEPARTE